MIQKRTPFGEKRVERNIVMRYQGGSYRVRLTLGGIKIDETFDSLPDARAYRDRMRADSTTDPTHKLVLEAKKKKEEAGQITLGTLLERYLKEITPTKKGSSVETYKIGKLMRYPIVRLPIYLVGRDAVMTFIETTHKEGWSDNSLRKYLMLLSGLFQVAVKRWGMTLINPIRSVQVPANGRPRQRRFEKAGEDGTSGEFDYLLAELQRARNPYAALVFEMATETAARRGELLGIRKKDVDLITGVPTVTFRDTKNGDDRVVPLSTRAVVMCRKVLDRCKSEDYLFPITAAQLRLAFEQAKKRGRKKYEADCCTHGIQIEPDFLVDIRFHDSRRECVSTLFEKGLNSFEVASVSGHRTMQLLKTYTVPHIENVSKKIG